MGMENFGNTNKPKNENEEVKNTENVSEHGSNEKVLEEKEQSEQEKILETQREILTTISTRMKNFMLHLDVNMDKKNKELYQIDRKRIEQENQHLGNLKQVQSKMENAAYDIEASTKKNEQLLYKIQDERKKMEELLQRMGR